MQAEIERTPATLDDVLAAVQALSAQVQALLDREAPAASTLEIHLNDTSVDGRRQPKQARRASITTVRG